MSDYPDLAAWQAEDPVAALDRGLTPSVVSDAAAAEALDALVEVARIGVVGDVRRMVDDFAKDVRAGLLTTAPSATREEVVDALVMTRLSDYAGTDMAVITQAADALLARFAITPKEDR